MLKVVHEYYVYNDLKKSPPPKLLVIPQLAGSCWKSCCYNVGIIRELRNNVMLYCPSVFLRIIMKHKDIMKPNIGNGVFGFITCVFT